MEILNYYCYKSKSAIDSSLRAKRSNHIFIDCFGALRLAMTAMVIMFLMVFGLLTANAAVPHLINYQGKLTDSSGAPLNGSYNITFRIYDAETAGNLLWQEQHTGIVIQKGIFSVLLGSVTALDLPFDRPYFLAIQVGTDPEMSPRQRITSAGYAIRAEKAENLAIVNQAQGDILYFDGIKWVKLGPGYSGQFLKTQGPAANPVWGSVSAVLGAWETKSNDTVYQALTDGFVCGIAYGGGNLPRGYTDSSNPPATLRAAAYSPGGESLATSFTMPVRKNNYWKVTGCVTVYWIQLGS